MKTKTEDGSRHDNQSDALELVSSVEIDLKASGSDGDSEPGAFTIVAYTGGKMRPRGFQHPVVAELSGMSKHADSLPIHLFHDQARPVGHAAVTIDRDVRLEGTFSVPGADADLLRSSGVTGFPWKASVGITIDKPLKFYRAGKRFTANGQSFQGPAFHAEETTLFETSFVTVAGDPETRVSIAASSGEPIMDESQTIDYADERGRIKQVNEVLAQAVGVLGAADIETIRAQAIDGEISVAEVSQKVLTALRSSRSPGPATFGTAGGTGADPAQMLEAAFMTRAGYGELAEQELGEHAMEASRDLHSASFVDIIRAAFSMSGMQPPRGRDELIRAAFSNHGTIQAAGSTFSIPTALGNVMNKVLMERYRDTPATWRAFCAIQNASDFKEQTGIRPSFVGDLEEIGPTGEMQHGSLDEAIYKWKVDTFGKMLRVDRRDIVNDSLAFIEEAARSMPGAAMRKLSDLVYKTLLAAGSSFFAPSLGNQGTAALSVTSLGAAIQAMRSQRDAENNSIDMQPATLLVPPELESTAKSALDSEYTERVATSADIDEVRPTGNPQRQAVKLEVEPRLSNTAKFDNADPNNWFLFGRPVDVPMNVGFLYGQQAPTTEFFGLDHDVKTLAVAWRVYHDFGAALGDHRAAYQAAVPNS